MQDYIGHNRRLALHAGRDSRRAALDAAEAGLMLRKAGHARAKSELERACWQDSAHAPVDRAHAAREALRAAHARRARLRDEMAEYEYDLIDDGDFDDLAA